MGRDTSAMGQSGTPITIRAQFLADWQDEVGHAGASGFTIPVEQPDTRANPPRGHWKQADVKRAIAAAQQAGLQHYRVEIAPDGTLAIVVGGPAVEAAELVAVRG
ncbi:hypothetical protein M3P36_10380 [Altererythrobacter sp. KTW20L]|uniref:hypothetical protein n=1 Tax=Altererythrobacter sp. KTW20L TaxID=2942210 RepID=UPI0020BD8B07|nr:hypothetical protein [Altererythrobacter sp. KTW20L]MCL6251444.1 hypothetical protein [Altererythrobacter sp. KTW20L]